MMCGVKHAGVIRGKINFKRGSGTPATDSDKVSERM